MLPTYILPPFPAPWHMTSRMMQSLIQSQLCRIINCSMNDYEYLFKFIMIGDSNVGKSCLLLRLMEGRFKSQHEPTLGVEFGSKIFHVLDKKVKLQIWDTAGQESFKAITRAYYKGSIACLLVFDLTCERSFQNLRHWISELRNHSHQKMRAVLIGNKNDLAQREVTEEQVTAFMKENKLQHYYETSALTGGNIEKPFIELCEGIVHDLQSGQLNAQELSGNGIKVKPTATKTIALRSIQQEAKPQNSQTCAC